MVSCLLKEKAQNWNEGASHGILVRLFNYVTPARTSSQMRYHHRNQTPLQCLKRTVIQYLRMHSTSGHSVFYWPKLTVHLSALIGCGFRFQCSCRHWLLAVTCMWRRCSYSKWITPQVEMLPEKSLTNLMRPCPKNNTNKNGWNWWKEMVGV